MLDKIDSFAEVLVGVAAGVGGAILAVLRFGVGRAPVPKDLCDERYKTITDRLDRIEGKIDRIGDRI